MSHRLHRNGRGSQHQTGEPSMASQSNSVSGSKSRKRRRKDESAQNSEAKRSRLSRSSPTGNTRTGNTKKVAGPGVKSSGKGTKEPSLDDSSQRKLHEFINKDEQPRLTPSRKRSSPGDSTSMEGVKRTRLEESFERSSVNKDNQKQKTVHTNRSKALTSEQHADTVRTQKRLPSNAAGTVMEKTTMGTSSKQATNAASADITHTILLATNSRTGNTKKVAGPGVKSSGKGTKEPSLDDSSQRKLREFINKDEQPRLTPSRKRSSPGDSTSMEGVKGTRLEESFERSSVNKDNQKQKTVHTNRSKALTAEQLADTVHTQKRLIPSNAAGTVTEKTTMGTSSKQATNAASADITPSESQEKQVEGEPSKTDKQNRYDRKAEHQTEQATTKPDKEKKKRKRAEQNPAPGKPRGPGNLKRKSVPKKEVRRRSTPGKHRKCCKWLTPEWQKPITDFPLQRINIISSSPANSQETQGESSTQHSTVSEVPLQSTDVGELEPSSQESNIQQRTLTQKSAEKDAKSKRRRRRRCGKCENCCMPDCGECNNCRCVDLNYVAKYW